MACRHDLEAIDWSFTQSMSWIRSIHHIGDMTEEAFKEMGLGGFEVATADGGRAELPTPGGASRKVTLENRLEFADMAEAFKMREFWEPVRQHTIEVDGYRVHSAVNASTPAGRNVGAQCRACVRACEFQRLR